MNPIESPLENPASAQAPRRQTRRDQAKAATRQKVLEAAARLFATTPYAQVTIRRLVAEVGLSTGAVFANFRDKADLWRQAMGSEPPLDGPAMRAAPQMMAALTGLLAIRPSNWFEDEEAATAWRAAAAAAALAQGQAAVEEDLILCIACGMAFIDDDQAFADIDGGFIHAGCCGPERESYVDLETGEPIGPNDPIPTGFRWGDA